MNDAQLQDRVKLKAASVMLAALKPLAFSAADNPPPGVDGLDWYDAVNAAKDALAAARAAGVPE